MSDDFDPDDWRWLDDDGKPFKSEPKAFDITDVKISIGGVELTGFSEEDAFEFIPAPARAQATATMKLLSDFNQRHPGVLSKIDIDIEKRYDVAFRVVRRERHRWRNAVTGAEVVGDLVAFERCTI